MLQLGVSGIRISFTGLDVQSVFNTALGDYAEILNRDDIVTRGIKS